MVMAARLVCRKLRVALSISRSLLGRLTVSSRRFARNERPLESSEPPQPPKREEPSISRCRRLVYSMSGFNKYGLYSEDLFDPTSPIVCEALRRLPEDVLDARNFRTLRAINLDFLGIQLPREEWLTIEQDVQNRYLSPYLRQVIAEVQEIHESGDTNYSGDYWPHNDVK